MNMDTEFKILSAANKLSTADKVNSKYDFRTVIMYL